MFVPTTLSFDAASGTLYQFSTKLYLASGGPFFQHSNVLASDPAVTVTPGPGGTHHVVMNLVALNFTPETVPSIPTSTPLKLSVQDVRGPAGTDPRSDEVFSEEFEFKVANPTNLVVA